MLTLTDYRLRRLIFVSAVCVYLHTHFVQPRTQDVSIKCTCNYEWPIDYQWYINIKCNGVIQNLGTAVSEKHFRTKSASALHPILPVYFNILSPGLGPYSNFEIVIIIFELENTGWVTTKRCFSIEETYFSTLNWEIHVYLYRSSKNRILSKRKNENNKQLKNNDKNISNENRK